MTPTHLLRSLVALGALAALAPAQSTITTLFSGGNGGSAGWTNMFDLTANNGISITALDLNISSGAGATGTVDVYMTAPGGTYLGNELTATPWMQVSSSATFTASAANSPTHATLNTPIVVAPGTYGVAILYNGVSMSYTNGNGSNQTVSNADLSMQFGCSTTAGFGGTINTPRVWNGTVYYFVGANYASATPFGTGCGGGFPSSFYEVFGGTNAFDLSNSGFTMLAAGSNYVVTPGATPIVTPTGAPLTIADDQTLPIALPWQMPYQNGVTANIWVCSNGFVSLESTAATDLTESVSLLTSGLPRVCPMWDDLNPGTTGGGTVNAEQDPTNPALFHVTWTGVPEYPAVGANTFQVTFAQSGQIEVQYGSCSVGDCMVGYSRGGGALDPGATDISAITAVPIGDDRPNLMLASVARPVLGQTATIETRNIPTGSLGGVVAYGLAQVTPPVDLSFLGMTRCSLLVGFDAQLGLPISGSTAPQSLPLPSTPGLAGAHLYLQSFVVAPGVNSFGIAATNGLDWRLDVQ